MQSILISAMLQSKQVYLPQLNDPQDFTAFLQHQTNAYKCIAHCEDEANKNDFADLKMHPEMLLLVGPEGDFTNDEIATAIKQNFTPVSLGSNRLRTETAGVVAAALFCI
jgi:16S rRNA (uracil1498-N3)-methyltransferase